MDDRNLGEILARDRIESSPYVLAMKKDAYCEQLCVSNLGHAEQKGVPSSQNNIVRAIRKKYHSNWIVDNLSAASKVEDDTTITTRYWGGFPIGYVSEEDNMAYINNHVNIEIMYHRVGRDSNKYRIVRFTVEPFSIKHDFEVPEDDDGKNSDGSKVVKVNDPIPSCDPTRRAKVHTSYKMIQFTSYIKRQPKRTGYSSFLSFYGLQPYRADDLFASRRGSKPQPASGEVLFTYDVIWIENTELEWTSRWDVYLTMDNAIPARVHWSQINSSLVVVIVLLAIIVANTNRDIARYKQLATDEEEATNREAWMECSSRRCFRPPVFAASSFRRMWHRSADSMLLVSHYHSCRYRSCWSCPSRFSSHGRDVPFVIMGVVAGYVTARMYKTFTGTSSHKAPLCTSLSVPGIAFAVFYFFDCIAPAEGRADAIPITTMLLLLLLWFSASLPLVFFGSHLGCKREAIKFPLRTSSIPRQIPDQPWFTGLPLGLAIGGIIPFGVCFVELYFILASVWIRQNYCTFGFLLLVYILLAVTCAEISVLFCYLKLRRENYRWWWSSFCMGGSPALYVFCFSIVYFKQLEYNSFEDYMYYYGYMGLGCFGLFLMTGAIGVFGTLWFNMILYSSIKLGEGK
ncbi:Nonaspanin (TM9SF) [Fragilaria crotonensis]|nr:Nonaspanin (TM9SF) [Fragilaria crotonensis]